MAPSAETAAERVPSASSPRPRRAARPSARPLRPKFTPDRFHCQYYDGTAATAPYAITQAGSSNHGLQEQALRFPALDRLRPRQVSGRHGMRLTRSPKRFGLAGSVAMRPDTALLCPTSLDPSSRSRTKRASASPAKRRACGFTPLDAPTPTRPASVSANGSGSARRYSTIPRRSRSWRWDSASRASTSKAATCRLAGNARKLGANVCSRACPISSLFCSSANTRKRGILTGTVVAGGLTKTVAGWRDVYDASGRPRLMPMPHPSWRNNAWLKRNPWFEFELLPR